MNEHYFHHKLRDPNKSDKDNDNTLANFKFDLRKGDWALGQIIDIANGTKHVKKRFFDLHHEKPGALGTARVGFPISSANYVFIDEDNAWPLYNVTGHVAQVWKERLHVV